MELLLNISWIVICTVALVLITPHALASRSSKTIFVALICALCLLFPIISVSDDLSADRETIDDATSIRRSMVAAAAHHDVQAVATLVGLVAMTVLVVAADEIRNPALSYSGILLSPQTAPRSPPRG